MGFIVTLIIIGLLLVFAEVLILPGVGVAGILGLLSLGGACYYAFTVLGSMAGWIVTGSIAVLLIILTVYSLRANTWKKLALNTNIDSKALPEEPVVAVGDRGKTLTRLAPMGSVRFGNVVVESKAWEGMLDPGVDVEVVMIEGGKVYVRPVNEN